MNEKKWRQLHRPYCLNNSSPNYVETTNSSNRSKERFKKKIYFFKPEKIEILIIKKQYIYQMQMANS